MIVVRTCFAQKLRKYDLCMFILGLLSLGLFALLLSRIGPRGRETLLLSCWVGLALPVAYQLGRLLLSSP